MAFYGRAGSALMKSLKRLAIDPLAVYGTLCVKCPVADTALADAGVRRARRRGAGHRAAQDRRRDGRGRARGCSTTSTSRSRGRSRPSPGEIQRLTPSIDALFVPNIDEALDDEPSKRAFWGAFQVLGQWYADLPPY